MECRSGRRPAIGGQAGADADGVPPQTARTPGHQAHGVSHADRCRGRSRRACAHASRRNAEDDGRALRTGARRVEPRPRPAGPPDLGIPPLGHGYADRDGPGQAHRHLRARSEPDFLP